MGVDPRNSSTQVAAAVLFVAVNLGVLLVAGTILTESAWDGLTYGNTWDGKGMSVGPGEYEACERVRRSGVRAPSNAYSSAFYLCAPTFQLASNGYLWSARSSRGLRATAALFGLVSVVLGVALAHASFLYHASITVELNRLDVRCMLLFTLHNTWKCVYMAARQLLHSRLGGAAWRGALRSCLAPALGVASLVALGLGATTDALHRSYDLLLPSTVCLMFGVSAGWAVSAQPPPGGLGRRAGQLHLLLFVAGIALKLLDGSKALCTTDAARDSPLQLTAAFHALTAVSTLMSDMHTNAQLSHDAEAEAKGA